MLPLHQPPALIGSIRVLIYIYLENYVEYVRQMSGYRWGKGPWTETIGLNDEIVRLRNLLHY
jgi:hypothetical protein